METLNITRGPLSDGELSQLLSLWNEVAPFLVTLNSIDWQDLLNMVHEWIYPQTITNAEIRQPTKKIMRHTAKQMVTDILSASRNRPGVQLWGKEITKRLGIDVEIPVEREYETVLLPPQERRSVAKEWES